MRKKKRWSRRRTGKRRSGVIPFKLIPRPAGLHPVTLSCSSSPLPFPSREHIWGDARLFSTHSLSRGRYFHPRVFHSSSMAIPFSFSYLSHCHNHSATVGFSEEPELTVFFTSIFPLYASMSCPFPSLPSQHAFPSHLPIPTFTFSHFHSPLMTSLPPPRPLFSLFSLPLAIFVLPPCHMFFFLPLPLTWVPFDETWIESGGVSAPCSSAPRRGCQGKRQALFTLNIIWHLICCTFCCCDERKRTELFPVLRETASIYPSLFHVGCHVINTSRQRLFWACLEEMGTDFLTAPTFTEEWNQPRAQLCQKQLRNPDSLCVFLDSLLSIAKLSQFCIVSIHHMVDLAARS